MKQIFILILLFVLSCSNANIVTSDQDELQIYAKIIETNISKYFTDNNGNNMLLVRDSTWIEGDEERMLHEINPDCTDINIINNAEALTTNRRLINDFTNTDLINLLVKDYSIRNKNKYHMPDKIPIKNTEIQFISNTELNTIFNHGIIKGWKLFYKKYPNSLGFISFSKVGFNNNKTNAIIYVEFEFGSKAATYDYYFLSKKNNKWDIVKEFNIGVA